MDTAASAGFSFQSRRRAPRATPSRSTPPSSIAKEIEAGDASTTIHIGATAFLGVEISTGAARTGGWAAVRRRSGADRRQLGGNSGNTGNSGTGQLRVERPTGAAIAGVVTNGPAQEAGLAQGDMITSLGGKTITSANDLTTP